MIKTYFFLSCWIRIGIPSVRIFSKCVFLILIICSAIISVPGQEYSKNKGEVTIEYIAHASFKLTAENHTLLLDPYADSVWISYTFPKNIQADEIFSTHPHYDHDGGIFRKLNPYWQGKIPFNQDPGNYKSGPFTIKGIKGKHCDPYGKEFGQKNTLFIFEVAGIRIAHWGDNAPINSVIAKELQGIDILLMPIDDTWHILSEEETMTAIHEIQPRVVIPMHYKIKALEPFADRPKNLGTIEQFIKSKSNLIELTSNKMSFTKGDIPGKMRYIVFQHAPYVN